MKAFPHKDFGIKRKDRRQLPGDPLMFSKLFYYVAQVLNVPLPEVFLVEDNKPADIQLANAIEKSELCPSFVVRPHLLQGKSEREIAFLSARRLTFMRPEYYLKMLLPTNTELKVVVLSAIVMVQPRFPVPPDMVQLVQQYLPEMQKRMPPQVLEQLGAVVAAVHPGGARDQPREVGPRGRRRRRIAPASWCAAISRSRRAWCRPSRSSSVARR